MRWTKTGAAIALLAAGWWLLQRTQPAAADGGVPQHPDPGMVRTFPNADPDMVRTLPNPDPRMVVTPPWPRDNTTRGSETEPQ